MTVVSFSQSKITESIYSRRFLNIQNQNTILFKSPESLNCFKFLQPAASCIDRCIKYALDEIKVGCFNP